jgi:hypothetical protein
VTEDDSLFEPWNAGAESQTRAEVIVPASPMTIEGVVEANRMMAQYAKRGSSGWRRAVVWCAAIGSLLFIASGVVVTLLTIIRGQ